MLEIIKILEDVPSTWYYKKTEKRMNVEDRVALYKDMKKRYQSEMFKNILSNSKGVFIIDIPKEHTEVSECFCNVPENKTMSIDLYLETYSMDDLYNTIEVLEMF